MSTPEGPLYGSGELDLNDMSTSFELAHRESAVHRECDSASVMQLSLLKQFLGIVVACKLNAAVAN